MKLMARWPLFGVMPAGTKCRLVDERITKIAPKNLEDRFYSCFNEESSRGAKPVPRFSAAAMFLDMLLLDKKIYFANGISEPYSSYLRFTDDGNKTYECLISITNGRMTVAYEEDEPTGIYKALPAFMMAFSNQIVNLFDGTPNSLVYGNEFTDAFSSIVDLLEENGSKEDITKYIFRICDSFYHALVKESAMERFDTLTYQYRYFKKELGGLLERDFAVPTVLKKCIEIKDVSVVAEADAEEINYSDKYKIEYTGWDDEDRKHIPSGILKRYVMMDEIESLAKIIKCNLDKVLKRVNDGLSDSEAIMNNFVNAILLGQPGTGKTLGLHALGEMLNLPVYSIPCSKNTEEDVIEGKNKVINGSINFVETDFIRAFEHGGIVILEEINLPDPAVMTGALNQATEYPFYIMKDGYKRVQRHPLCVIIGTMNPALRGTKPLNEALSSRFRFKYELKAPTKNDFIDILMTQGHTKKASKKVYETYSRILTIVEDEDPELKNNLSLRQCYAALDYLEAGVDLQTAVKYTMVGAIAEKDSEIAENILTSYVQTLPAFV